MAWRKLVALALLIAAPAYLYAQSVTTVGQRVDPSRRTGGQAQLQGGLNYSDSTVVAPAYGSTGSASVTEASPDRSANLTFANVLTGVTALAINAADSNSTPLDTRGMRLGTLLIKAVLGGTGTVDTTCVARLAIQIRTHLNNQDDSSSTFPIYQYGVQPSNVATAAAGDSSLSGHLQNVVNLTGITATPGAFYPWSGEYIIQVAAKRAAHGSSVSVSGHTFYYPNGIAIPLSSLFGRDIYSPYTSIRVRVMSFQKGAASLTTGTVNVTAHLVGTPL